MADVHTRMTVLRRVLPSRLTQALLDDLVAWQEEIADRVIERLQEYPPELDGQRYVRTGDLGRAWFKTPSRFLASAGLIIEIHNDVVDRHGKRYASLVQGMDQRPIHQYRWLREDEALQQERTDYRAGIRQILDSHGFRR